MREKITRLEVIIVLIVFTGLGAILAANAGGPLHSDEVWYMHLGLNGVRDAHWLNRYFHVYSQLIFLRLAPMPLDGARAFWAFLVASTGLLVYFGARSFRKGSNFVHGILAVALFLSFPLLRDFSGVTLIDITGMTVVMFVLWLYLYSYRHDHKQSWPLILMGTALFLAFKTKENNVLVGFLSLGLGYAQSKPFRIARLLKGLRSLFSGVLIGVALFAVLDGIILGDALFSLRPSNWKQTIDFYVASAPTNTSFGNWFSAVILPLMPVASLLYLVSGVRSASQKLAPALKLVWLFPLLFVSFLIFSIIRSQFGIIDRYIFPIVPVVSLLAVQFLDFDMPRSILGFAQTGVATLVGLLLLGAAGAISYRYADSLTVHYRDLLFTIVQPLLFVALVGSVFLFDRFSSTTVVIPILCIAALAGTALASNFNSIFRLHSIRTEFERKYYPFMNSVDKIDPTEEMKICVSTDLAQNEGMLSNKIDELLSMFNVVFEVNAGRENFEYLEEPGDLSDGLQHCDYLFTSKDAWALLSELGDPTPEAHGCDIWPDDQLPLVFVDCVD